MMRTTNHILYIAVFVGLLFINGCASFSAALYNQPPDAPGVQQRLQELENRAVQRGDADLLLEAGWAAWTLNNDAERAQSLWKKAEALSPKRAEIPMALAQTYYFGGHFQLAQQACLRVLAQQPGGIYARLAAARLASLYDETPDFPKQVRPVLESLLDDERLERETRLSITNTLRLIYREQNLPELEKAMRQRQGKITRWQFVGPFGTVGLIDFDRSYKPETDALQAQYDTPNGAVQAVAVDLEKQDVSFSDLSEFGGVFYAAGAIELQQDRNVVLRLKTKELAQLFIDGRPVLTVDPRTRHLPMLHPVQVQLAAGRHRLLVKLGESNSRLNFTLNIVGENGEPVAFTQFNELSEYNRPAASSRNATFVSNVADIFYERAERRGDLLSLYYANLANQIDEHHARLVNLRERALAINPNFAPLYVLEALRVTRDPSLPGGVAQDRARAALRHALELDERQAIALQVLAQDAVERDRSEEAIAMFKQLERLTPEAYNAPYALYSLYESKGWRKEAEQAKERALLKNGRNLQLLKSAFRTARNNSEFKRADELSLRIDALDGTGHTRLNWLQSQGKYMEVEKLLRTFIEREPYKVGHRTRLADTLLQAGKFAEAIEVYRELATWPGHQARYARSLAQAYRLNGQAELAEQTLQQALELEPGDFTLRDMMTWDEGSEILGEYVTKTEPLLQSFKEQTYKPEAGVVLVLDEYIQKVLPDASSVTRTHTITRVQTKDAISRFGEVRLPSSATVYRLRVIKPDGRELLPERIGGKRSVTLPDIEVGDFIEMDYVQGQDLARSINGGRTLSSSFLFQNTHIPTFRSRFTVIHPEEMAMNLQPLNYNLNAPTIERENGWVMTRYDNEKIDALTPEPFMPVQLEVIPMVRMTRPLQWTEVRDLLRQRLLGKTIVAPEIEAFYREHVQQGESERETAERLFYAVTEAIEGEDNDSSFRFSASNILAQKEGNRLILLQALLSLHGLQSEFLLAKPQNIKEIEFKSANFNTFDEAMLRVHLSDGEVLYLSAGYKESVFNQPSPMLSGSKALVLAAGNEAFTQLPVWMQVGEDKQVSLFVKLNADGSAQNEASERISGYYSVPLRRTLKRLPKDRIEQFFEMILNKNFPGAALENVDIQNIENAKEPLKLHYTFNVRRMAKPLDRRLSIDGAFFPLYLSRAYIRTPERHFPYLVNGINSGFNTSVLQLPEGYVVSRMPESQEIESPYGVYRYHVERKEDTIIITRDFTIPIQRIELENYMDFYRFCMQVDQLEQQQIHLVPGDTPENLAKQP